MTRRILRWGVVSIPLAWLLTAAGWIARHAADGADTEEEE